MSVLIERADRALRALRDFVRACDDAGRAFDLGRMAQDMIEVLEAATTAEREREQAERNQGP